MRARFVIAVSIAGLLAVPARAADLPAVYWGDAPVYGYPAAPVVIYDDNPGVTMRAYWEDPWAGRRYFPATGIRPRYGRHERLSLRRVRLPQAENFYRSWSTSSAFVPDRPGARLPLYDLAPPARRFAPPPVKP